MTDLSVEAVLALLSLGENGADPARPKIKEVITLRKFDKTDVTDPGVAGLTPFEEIVLEDGQLVAVRRTGLDPEPVEG
jgi:hypothetical protein